MKGSRWLWALVWLAVCASVPVAGQRWAMENASRHVELVGDIQALAELAEQAGAPLSRVLAMWRQAGLTAVSVPPLRLGDLEGVPEGATGAVEGVIVASGAELARWRAFSGAAPDLGGLPLVQDRTYLFFPAGSDPQWTRDVIGRIARRFTSGPGSPPAGAPAGGVWISERSDGARIVALPYPDGAAARRLVLGFSPLSLEYARSLGLRPVFRPVNAEGASRLAADLAETGEEPGLIIFEGATVVGYPHALEQTAAALEGWSLGWIEFHRQLGLPHLINMMDGRAVRVHSITPGEMARLTPDGALARWMRAARERGARVLYVRPFLRDNPRLARVSDEALLAANAAYVKALADRLQAHGFRLGPARPLRAWKGPFVLLLLGVLGVGAGGALVLRELGAFGFRTSAAAGEGQWRPGCPRWVTWLLEGVVTLAPVLAVAVLYLKGYTVLSRQAAAFLATLVFPVLAVLVAARWTEEVREAARPALPALAVTRAFAVVAAITLGGALILVNLLADYRFMLGSAQYLGVKAAHAVPVLVTAGVALAAFWGERWRGPSGNREVAVAPAGSGPGGGNLWIRRLAVAAAGAAVLAAFAVYVLRTGHGWLPVLPWEQQFRLWLEGVLPVRPRSRELFVGYPALLLGFTWLAAASKGKACSQGKGCSRGKAWGWACLAAGTVAPVAVMNTFAHVHSPLAVSLVRSGLGLVFGVACGLAVLGMLVGFRRLAAGWGNRGQVAGVPWGRSGGDVRRVQ